MVNIGDIVHVYNDDFGEDYQAVVLDVFDDGTSQVQSTGTGIKYLVETANLHSLEVCPTLHAPDAANVCRVINHFYVDGVCSQCGSIEPPRQ